MRFIRSAYVICIAPRSADEDSRRKEFVLNALLCISIAFTLCLDFLVLHQTLILEDRYRGVPLPAFSLLILLFITLLVLSRLGHGKFVAYCLLALYTFGTAYTAWIWGFDIPSVVVGSLFIIAISSILISTRASIVIAIALCASLVLLAQHQTANNYPSHTWRNEEPTMHDAWYYAATLLLIVFLHWLSNRQTEYSLNRARRSEEALTKERDQLEITVEERTREIRRLQMERVTELHHKAEFGNISSGAFHDLMNPLSSIHLITSEIGDDTHEKIPEFKEYISHALNASRKMQHFLDVLRKQMRSDKDKVLFSPRQEIEEALLLLSYKTKKAGCVVHLKETGSCQLFGNPITFYQIIANLVSNSIDAYEHKQHDKHINITFGKKGGSFVLEATDSGCGIAEENLAQVFESFFTTKPKNKGSGLGLATTKHIVEKEFDGTISVQSSEATGTTFTITIPLHEDKHRPHKERLLAGHPKTSVS